jgi:hypothetical protein
MKQSPLHRKKVKGGMLQTFYNSTRYKKNKVSPNLYDKVCEEMGCGRRVV